MRMLWGLRLLVLALVFFLSSCNQISSALSTEIVVTTEQGAVPTCMASAADASSLDGAVPIRAINEANVAAAIRKIDALVAKGAKRITLHIDSAGGIIGDGMELVRVIEGHRRQGVHTVCVADGQAASMAFLILQSPACQLRLATKRTTFLMHEPWVQMRGNQYALRRAAEALQVTSDVMAEIIGSRLNLGVDGYKQRVRDGDWIFGWEEAIRVGAIDGVIDPKSVSPVYTLVDFPVRSSPVAPVLRP